MLYHTFTCIELFVHHPSLVQPRNHPISPSPTLGKNRLPLLSPEDANVFPAPQMSSQPTPPGHVTLCPETAHLTWFVVEPTPLKKCSSKWVHLPQIGVKIKHI